MCKTQIRICVHARIIEGSRVCKPCNVLAARKYGRASMVWGYTTPSHLKLRISSNIRKCKTYKNTNWKLKITTFKNDRGFASESKVCNEGCNEQQSDYLAMSDFYWQFSSMIENFLDEVFHLITSITLIRLTQNQRQKALKLMNVLTLECIFLYQDWA